MLVDAQFRGQPRKLLLQANRNGFFYVLDRLTGKVLLAEPFVKKLTWASGIGPDGRPKLLPGNEPTVEGQCVSGGGGRHQLALDGVQPGDRPVLPDRRGTCNIYTKNDEWWEAGKSFYGGGTRRAPGEQAAASFSKRSISRPERPRGKFRASAAGFWEAV